MVAGISWDGVGNAICVNGDLELVSLGRITYFDPSCFGIWLEKEAKFVIIDDGHVSILVNLLFCRFDMHKCPAFRPELGGQLW